MHSGSKERNPQPVLQVNHSTYQSGSWPTFTVPGLKAVETIFGWNIRSNTAHQLLHIFMLDSWLTIRDPALRRTLT
jgi:hypothetical protein